MHISELQVKHKKEYLHLLKQLTFYDYEIEDYEFAKRYILNQNNLKVFVILEDNKLVAAGSIFKLEKLHNNPIGQIEDVVVNEEFRGKGYGKKIIETLTEYGIKKWNCYKIVLNSLEKNLKFYEKLDFVSSGFQMKFVK